MKKWFVSDTHFGHANIIKYCNRPFHSVHEMENALIQNWNQYVGKDDVVYHLGDFAMGEKSKMQSQIERILSQVNGNLIVIRGNHDHSKNLVFFPSVVNSEVIKIGTYDVELVHNPSHAKWDKDFTLCGHVHNSWRMKHKDEIIPGDIRHNPNYSYDNIVAKTFVLNVGVDVHGFRPISEDEVLEMYESSKKQNIKKTF
jgi:calcineurin-like phosphoesterase family protein